MKKVKVRLDDLLEAYELGSSEIDCYIDTKINKVVRHIDEAYDGDPEETKLKKKIEKYPNRFIPIPKRESRDEYEWMVEFTESLDDKNLKENLFIALDGKGAFKRFKNVLLNYPEKREKWFKFKDKKMKQDILEWCKENEIEYEEETK
jgi:hypothetical protein